MRLRVSIGTRKDDLQTAWVNVEDKPTEIDTEFWVGRVLVRVKDFDGFTPDGSPPAEHSEYFEGRNRRFHIQAEGRFKKQYSGDQVWFGTQFDHMIGNFPETLFNAGMRIAKYIDPAVFYDKNSATPYIMSPYLACVNTLSAWPAPHRSHDAVLALENGNAQTESDDEHDEDEVPREMTHHSKKSITQKPIRYWSFQGFREDDGPNNLISHGGAVDTAREGSIRTQSTKFDEERMVTAENPQHCLALTRLGSYGRDPATNRNSVIGVEPTLSSFPETLSDDEYQDDNESFYTAAEYIFEDEMQPDGTVKPVKKVKKGLTVKKVRKSLHIPSAKTVQKNMRGLSIKRKDKAEKRIDSISSEPAAQDSSRASGEHSYVRKSLDLMRPFRFGHHDKDSGSSQRSRSVTHDSTAKAKHASSAHNSLLPKSRTSISDDRMFSTKPLNPRTVAPEQVPTRQEIDSSAPRLSTADEAGSVPQPRGYQSPLNRAGDGDHFQTTPVSQGRGLSTAPPLQFREDGTLVLPSPATSHHSASSSPHLGSQPSNARISTDTVLPDRESSSTSQRSSAVAIDAKIAKQSLESTNPTATRNPAKSAGLTEIRADRLITSADENDGLSHRLDGVLGPWRFRNPKIEPIEDTAFIFGDTSHSVKDRRKHFAKNSITREEFEFNTDIVYCMSFFLPYMNFNTFDLKLGPLGANLHKYVNDQPIRYMARCSERPEEVFFMVEFNLE